MKGGYKKLILFYDGTEPFMYEFDSHMVSFLNNTSFLITQARLSEYHNLFFCAIGLYYVVYTLHGLKSESVTSENDSRWIHERHFLNCQNTTLA